MKGPLSGMLVLDLTRNLPGPYCGMLLADQGAEVVKIEEEKGDPVRFLPPFVSQEGSQIGVGFRSINAGKKSVAIDLKRAEGISVLLRLVERADVLLDGFRPGVLERLGAGEAACRARNPRLVYVSITGFGERGPYRDRAGHDLNYESFAGALDEAVPSVQVADMGGALAAFAGVLLSLLARERTGEAPHVSAPLLQAAFSLQPFRIVPPARGETALAAETLSGKVPCYRLYATRDGRRVALAALEPKFWEVFCEIVSREEWLSRAHDPSLVPEVEALFLTRTFDEWRLLEGSECCVSGVLRPEEAARDPQVEALGLVVMGEDGRPARVAPPFSLQGASAPPTRAPARAGEDTREVLSRFGLSRDEIEHLRARRAIAAPESAP
ncbi:CoA transferase [bacterium]|nr:CoA transferase [bacterium]